MVFCIVFSGNNFNPKTRDLSIDDNNFITDRHTVDNVNESFSGIYDKFDGNDRCNVDNHLQQLQHEANPSFDTQMPMTAANSFSTNVLSNLTTVQALIETVATNGDFYEDIVRSEHSDLMQSQFW